MPNLTVKNIPDDVYLQLKQLAAANRRSLNSEIIACLERSVHSQAIDPEQILVSARSIREKTAGYVIDVDKFNRFKNAGRS